MTKTDIEHFIEIMREICDYSWTPERVEEEYGDCETLREAIDRRLNKINSFYRYVEEVVKPEAEALGLWKKQGNQPDPPCS